MTSVAICKGNYVTEFVTLPNTTARDTRLSLQARGLLLYLISLPGDWKVSRKHLARENGVNEKTIQKYINELKEYGYATYQISKVNGRFTGGDYLIYPIPQKTAEASNTGGSTADPKSGSPVNWAGEKAVDIQKKDLDKEKKETKEKKKKKPAPEKISSSKQKEVNQDEQFEPIPLDMFVEMARRESVDQGELDYLSIDQMVTFERKLAEYATRYPNKRLAYNVYNCIQYAKKYL